MAQKDRINPLTWNRPIADAKGWPTREFQIKWEQLSRAALAIPSLSTPAAVSAVLDVLSGANVNGSILVRSGGMWNGYPSPSDGTKFLAGNNPPTWENVTDLDLSLSDVVANNVDDTRHGFAPKAPNDATQYLDGTGNWSTPAGGGGGGSGMSWFTGMTGAANFTGGNTTSALATKGYVVTPTRDCTIYALYWSVDQANSGDTYRGIIATANPTTGVIGSTINLTSVVSAGATDPRTIRAPFATPVQLTAGVSYFIGAQVTSGVGTTAARLAASDTLATLALNGPFTTNLGLVQFNVNSLVAGSTPTATLTSGATLWWQVYPEGESSPSGIAIAADWFLAPAFLRPSVAGVTINDTAFTGLPIFPSKSMTVTGLRIYCTAAGSSRNVVAGIYAGAGLTLTGGALQGQSAAIPAAVGLMTLPFASPINLTANTWYWMGVDVQGGSGNFQSMVREPTLATYMFFTHGSGALPGTAGASTGGTGDTQFNWWLY